MNPYLIGLSNEGLEVYWNTKIPKISSFGLDNVWYTYIQSIPQNSLHLSGSVNREIISLQNSFGLLTDDNRLYIKDGTPLEEYDYILESDRLNLADHLLRKTLGFSQYHMRKLI